MPWRCLLFLRESKRKGINNPPAFLQRLATNGVSCAYSRVLTGTGFSFRGGIVFLPDAISATIIYYMPGESAKDTGTGDHSYSTEPAPPVKNTR